MKLLLVYPNISKAHTPQMGLLSLCSFMLEKGVDTFLCDLTFVNPNKYLKHLINEIGKYKPDIVGFSCRTMEYPLVEYLASEVRKNFKKIMLIAGGPHVTFSPLQIAPHVDYLIIGEGEETLYEITQLYANNEKHLIKNIQNVGFMKNGKLHCNSVRPLIDINLLPQPRYEIFNELHYKANMCLEIIPTAKICGVFEGSRGCPYTCSYCSNKQLMDIYKGKGKWRREKSSEKIKEEIDSFKRHYGLDMIYFIDEVIMTSDDRTQMLRRCLSEEQIPFIFMERPELITEKRVIDIKKAGAYSCSIGIESGNQEFRSKLLGRSMTDEKINKAYKLMKKHGIKTHSFIMLGLPMQTKEVMQETYNMIEAIQPDTAQATTFFPLPGTELSDFVKKEGLLDKEVSPTSYYSSSVLNYEKSHKEFINKMAHMINLGIWKKSSINKVLYYLCMWIPKFSYLIYYVSIVTRTFIRIGFRQTMQKIIIKTLNS